MKLTAVCWILFALEAASAREDSDKEAGSNANDPSVIPQVSSAVGESSRIINGQTATRGMFPYEVAIIHSDEFCGGSLISDSWVLTAAHCCVGTETFEMTFGANNLGENEDGTVKVNSSKKIVHEKYNRTTLNNDICLIKLPTKMKTSRYIQTIKLITRAMAGKPLDNQIARVSGWGRTSPDDEYGSDILKYVDVPVISNSECQKAFPKILSSNICTAVINKRGFCKGDSGGPLVVDGYQVGVVSFTTKPCDAGAPDVYSRCGSYLDWIQKNTGIVLP